MADEAPPLGGNSANGASSATQAPEGARVWERPWTLEEMRKGAGNWSLAGDAGLLLYLQDFSQKMIVRTHEIEKEVGSLVHDAKLTSVRVNNVFNDFIMLANEQFVENRVYDEDVSQEDGAQDEKKGEDQEKTREQKEAALIPKVTEAIALGVDVIDKAFEKLDTNIDNSDSEDEDDAGYRVDPILEAKDPYIVRSLPHLIGTPKFMEDDNVGLEEISDYESDQGSLSESEGDSEGSEEDEDKESEYSYSETESESDSDAERPPPKQTKRIVDSGSEESDSDGDLFGTKKARASDDDNSDGESEDDAKTETPRPSGAIDFTSELAKKIGVVPVRPPSPTMADGEDEWEDEKPRKESTTSETKSRKKERKKEREKERSKSKSKVKKQEPAEDNLFGSPPDDEDGDLFGQKGGLFSKTSGGLFDDDKDDEGGLFDDEVRERKSTKVSESEENTKVVVKEKKERKRTISGKKVPIGGVSIFGGGDKDLFSKSPSVEPEPVTDEPDTSQKPAAPKSTPAGGLFDDDEDDLFAAPTSLPKQAAKKAPKKEEKKAVDLFAGDDDDDDDLFGDATTKVPEFTAEPEKDVPPKKKMPAGAVSMFGTGPNPLIAALKKQRPDSDEEDKDDFSDGEKSRSGSIKSSHSAASRHSETAKIPTSQSKDSLFSEEPDDSLFATTTKPKSNSFSKKAKPAASLFDNVDEDNLFGTKPPAAKTTAPKVATKAAPSADALFGAADDDDDMFPAKSVAKQPQKKKPAGAVSMFPGGADPFAKKHEPITNTPEPMAVSPKVEEPKPEPPRKRQQTRSISLFGGDEDAGEGDNLFDTVAAKSPPKKPPPPAKKSGRGGSLSSALFDDDAMFGGEVEAPDVDIFKKTSSPEPKKPDPAPSINKVVKPVATRAKPAADLFGGDDDEDDDLFVTATTKSAKPAQKVDVFGATTTESTDTKDDIQDDVEPAPKQKKPPVGGVSMFGGVDPFAAKKAMEDKQDGKKDTKVEPPAVEKKVVKNKEVDPLFGGDEEDDLFGSGPSKKVAPKPAPLKQRPDSLFDTQTKQPESKKTAVSQGPLDFEVDNDDHLFGAGPKPGVKPTDSETPETKQDVDTQEKVEQPASPVVEHRKRPAGAVSMFGGVDPFAAIKKPEPTLVAPALSSPDEDLFSPRIQKPKPTAPVPIPKARPVGFPITSPVTPPKSAVSPVTSPKPVGRMDKLQEPKPTAPVPIAKEPKPTTPVPIAKAEPVVSPVTSPMTSPTSPGKIGRLQANLNFNPAAMLPGAAPPVVEAPPLDIGFDIPAEAKVLVSANKDRAKIQTKRRPPTRHFRKTGSAESPVSPSEDVFNVPSLVSPIQSPASARSPSPTIAVSPPRARAPSPVLATSPPRVPSVTATEPPPKARLDMFGNEDLFNSDLPKSDRVPVTKHKDTKPDNTLHDDTFSADLFGGAKSKNKTGNLDDLFSGPVIKTEKKEKMLDNDSDIYNSVPIKTTSVPNNIDDDDIFAVKKSKQKPKPSPIIEDDDDELFSSPALSKSKDTKPRTKTGDSGANSVDVTDAKGLHNDVTDDIFANVTPVSHVKEAAKEVSPQPPDDIFADSTLEPKQTKAKEDHNDILSEAAAKPERKKVKKAKTKDEDIFADDTDIFADIPKAKPKEKKPKKKNVVPKKAIFKDDIDDIFADTTSTKPKEKKKKTTTTKAKSKSKTTSGVVDDPLAS